jgi:exodeoxyribonuclease VII large subunit
LSYHGVLARGFALVRAEDGRPLRAAAAVSPGLRLDIEFADGRVGATADGATVAGSSAGVTRAPVARGAVADPGRPKPRRAVNPGQGSLF